MNVHTVITRAAKTGYREGVDPLKALCIFLQWYWDDEQVEARKQEAREQARKEAREKNLGEQQRRILLLAAGQPKIRLPRYQTRAEAKSLSRAAKLLEQRGLAQRLRRDGRRGTPTYWIRLTPAGIEAAQSFELQEAA